MRLEFAVQHMTLTLTAGICQIFNYQTKKYNAKGGRNIDAKSKVSTKLPPWLNPHMTYLLNGGGWSDTIADERVGEFSPLVSCKKRRKSFPLSPAMYRLFICQYSVTSFKDFDYLLLWRRHFLYIGAHSEYLILKNNLDKEKVVFEELEAISLSVFI